MNYIEEARRIVTGYFAAAAPSEQLRRETAQELRLATSRRAMPAS